MKKIKAIETEYKGYRFRSRLEARWAVFFETLGIEWRYEPEGYVLESGEYYLPDFYLPNVPVEILQNKKGCFVEVKGKWEATPDRINEYPVITLLGKIEAPKTFDVAHDVDHCFLQCQGCGLVKIGFCNGYRRKSCNCNPRNTISDEKVLEDEDRYTKYLYWDGYGNPPFHKNTFREPVLNSNDRALNNIHTAIGRAYRNAKQARFEHGETPNI